MSTNTVYVELVEEEQGEVFARVPVQITEIAPGEEQAPGHYFFFLPDISIEDIGSKREVVLHGPFETDEECVLAASDFILKAAEQRAAELTEVAA